MPKGTSLMQTKIPTATFAPALDVAVSINRNQLINGLLKIKGAKPITMICETVPRMRKTNNPFFGRIIKRAEINGMVNFHYDKGVLRRLKKEGKDSSDFCRGTSWHEPVMIDGKLTPLCKHKSKDDKYIRFMLRNGIESTYCWTDSGDMLTDDEAEQVETFIQSSNSYDNQGLDEPLIFLTYGIESVKVIRIDKQTYTIKQ